MLVDGVKVVIQPLQRLTPARRGIRAASVVAIPRLRACSYASGPRRRDPPKPCLYYSQRTVCCGAETGNSRRRPHPGHEAPRSRTSHWKRNAPADTQRLTSSDKRPLRSARARERLHDTASTTRAKSVGDDRSSASNSWVVMKRSEGLPDPV
jgi:hypothetical protein